MKSRQVSPGIAIREDGKYICFWCEGCGEAHGWLPLNTNGRTNGWSWDELTLTLSPSVRLFDGKDRTTCHFNVEHGRVVHHGDSLNHSLRGWRAMQEFPAGYGLTYELEES